MNKKPLTLLTVVFLISMIASLPLASATEPGITGPGDPHKIVPNKNEIFWESIGMPETVDPQWLYDTASAELVQNVYDTLIFFDWEETAVFVPSLAVDTGTVVDPASIPDEPYPGDFVYSIIFEVRQGVPFQLKRQLYTAVLDPATPISTQWVEHTPVIPYITQVAIDGREYHMSSWIDVNANGVLDAGDQVDLTRKDNGWVRYYHVESLEWTGAEWKLVVKPKVNCEDIEYTFERWMVFDRSGGPTWMIFEALMGEYGIDPDWPADLTNPIAKSVQSNCSHVWFNFKYDYSVTIFKQVIAQSWASILNKDWAIDQGCWNGVWADWLLYNDPETSPLMVPAPVMMGAGPYELDYINFLVERWRLRRFDEYWQGWPAPGCSSYAEYVTYKTIYEWSDRFIHFTSTSEADQCDLCTVPRANVQELEPWVEPLGEIRYMKDILTLALSPAMFLNMHIPDSTQYPGYESPYIGNEQFSEYGTPWDFFQDPNVRYAFAYAFNYDAFFEDQYTPPGATEPEASQPASPLIKGVGFDALYEAENEAHRLGTFVYDQAAAIAMFKQAWTTRVGLEGYTGLWDTGFTMTFTYNEGNTVREAAATMLADELSIINPKFHADAIPVSWPTYLSDLVNYPIFKSTMPMFLIGWLADYPDPHNFFFPFYHTQGDFTFFQSWDEVAPDLNANGKPDCDEKIEAALTAADRSAAYKELMDDWCVDVPTIPLVQPLGRHYERTWVQGWYDNPILPGPYFYIYWKGLDGDLNGDNRVNALDFGVISSYWHPGGLFPDGPLGYDRKADVNDANSGAWPTGAGYATYGLMVPYDGYVDSSDSGYVNAHWGDMWP